MDDSAGGHSEKSAAARAVAAVQAQDPSSSSTLSPGSQASRGIQ